ncbi:MAG: hypothetical protein IJ733_14900 [Lachnospiraceae bacterium]|nr:hypothetical protein [Lachnospiraceae bacterium]
MLNETITTSETVTISREEYEQLLKAKNNLEYLEKLDRSEQQLREGKVIRKTWEEPKEMANG